MYRKEQHILLFFFISSVNENTITYDAKTKIFQNEKGRKYIFRPFAIK